MLTIILIIANLFINNFQSQQTITTEMPIRPSIVFIVGEDEKDSNQYFTLAKQYYLSKDTYKYHEYVDTCRSLVAVRNYLEMTLPEASPAWGDITIVLHSNQWTGLSTPVVEGGERVTLETLYDSMQKEEFKSLPNTVVDSFTTMEFKACGLGKNTDLLDALQIAFGGFDYMRPKVKSSEDFVYYQSDEHQQIQPKSYKPFYAFYKTAYKPADLNIKKQLETKYPNTQIDWLDAMNNKQARWENDAFHCKFNVPIEWTLTLDNTKEMPSWKTEAEKITFVESQKDLMNKLNSFDIPINKFRWKITSKKEDGKVLVKIKGKSTVLCILAES